MRRRTKDLRRRKLQARIRRQREQLRALAERDAERGRYVELQVGLLKQRLEEVATQRRELLLRYSWKLWRRLRFVVTGR